MKDRLLEQVTELTLYTGTNGRRGCTCSCIGCTQTNRSMRHKPYQGSIEQVRTVIEKLPNLKNAYILGNPDISVDTGFCNVASKEFIKNGKKVMYSTSGYNGKEIIKKLTNGINPDNIEYVSYSVDTLDSNKLKFLKGNPRITLEEIEDAIRLLQRKKY